MKTSGFRQLIIFSCVQGAGRGAPSGRGASSGGSKAMVPKGMQPIAMKKQDGMLVPEGNLYFTV